MKSTYKYLLIVILTCCLWSTSKAQDSTEQFSQHLLIGTSLTYIWDASFPTWQEYTLHFDVSYAITKRWNVGANVLRIWSGDSNTGINRYLITGVDGQFNFVNDPDIRLFGEGGLYYGNYCTCGTKIPYLNRRNTYWALGAGMSVRIRKNLFFELSFQSYNIMNNIPMDFKYNYTQYIVGLEYRIRTGKQLRS